MDELCQKLHAAFAPIVAEVLEDVVNDGYEYTSQVEHAGSPYLDDDVYEFCVIIHGDGGYVPAGELCEWANALQEFQAWETLKKGNHYGIVVKHDRKCPGSFVERLTIEGNPFKWAIGDGDDSLAVTYRNGMFRIWIRPLDDDGALEGLGG